MQNRVSYADEASKKEFLKFLQDALKTVRVSVKCCKISLKNDDFDEKTRLEVQADMAK
ncbi:MAG: hypothetical protein ACTTJC_03965 [Campylobacter sp.]